MASRRDRPKQIRGEQLVSKIFEATLAELARVDFESLSMETVAERAGVNKSTLYRRWPTKLELVRAALEELSDMHVTAPDYGNLRADLSEHFRGLRDICLLPDAQAIMRLVFGGRPHPDLAALTDAIGERKDQESAKMIERAIARGELPRGVDVQLLIDTLGGTILNIMLFKNEPCDDAKIERLLDMVLDGVKNGGGCIARPIPRAKRPRLRAS